MHKVMHKNKIYKLSHGTNAHKKSNEPQNGPKTNNCILFCCSPDIATFFWQGYEYPRANNYPFDALVICSPFDILIKKNYLRSGNFDRLYYLCMLKHFHYEY